VGIGGADAIASFRDTTSYRGPLFVDPSLATYRAAGLASGVGTILNPRAIAKNLSAMVSGTRPGMPSGNSLQQGGTFVLGPGDVDRFAWRDRFSGDHAALDQVLKAVSV
jgi:hypothetical protein